MPIDIECALRERLRIALAGLPATERYWVAYSGGCDSHVLLRLMAALRDEGGRFRLAAAHVNHGLHPEADEWARHSEGICRDLAVDFRLFRVEVTAGKGESPEAAARRARYAALERPMALGDILLTAHHADDQAETLLLQMLRGAGVEGLSGMAGLSRFGHGWLARPLLPAGRDELRRCAVDEGLSWIEDPSNEDRGVPRNFIRHEILSRLAARWPETSGQIGRVALLQADAARLAKELAAIDMESARGTHPETLSVLALRASSAHRAHNLLRAWVRQRGLPPPGSLHLVRIMSDLVAARRDRTPLVCWPGAEIRRYRDDVFGMHPSPAIAAADPVRWEPPDPVSLPGGRLTARRAEGRGLSMDRAATARLEVRFRRGGERLRPAGRRGTRPLKKLLQELGIPPWERHRIPLVFADGRLAAVAGWFVDEAHAAKPGEPGWILQWEPEAGPRRAKIPL